MSIIYHFLTNFVSISNGCIDSTLAFSKTFSVKLCVSSLAFTFKFLNLSLCFHPGLVHNFLSLFSSSGCLSSTFWQILNKWAMAAVTLLWPSPKFYLLKHCFSTLVFSKIFSHGQWVSTLSLSKNYTILLSEMGAGVTCWLGAEYFDK